MSGEAGRDRPLGARVHTVTVAPDGPTFEVLDGERILAAARRAGIWLPFECGWGSCATCKVTLVEGKVELLFAGAPAITERDARRRRMLTCQTTPRTDLVIKPLSVGEQPSAERPTEDHRAELASVEELGPEIRRFRFALDRPAVYREGQHAVLDVGDGLRRCYSMSTRPGQHSIEFIAKRYPDGPVGHRLAGLRPGQVIDVELPYGDMWLRPAQAPIVLIAGGTGVAPILAMARQLHAQADPRPVRVFYGAASSAELVAFAELAELVDGLPDGRLHGALERPDTAGSHTRGFVTHALTDHLTESAHARYYLAGPPPMVDAVLAWLKAAGVELSQIHYDRFG